MNENDIDLEAVESSWPESDAVPLIKDAMPETSMAVKAEKVFEEQIIPISAIEKRRAELGVENAALATREQRASLATVNGLCRKVNGQVEKVRKFLVEDAVRVQKVVNARAKDIKAEVAVIQKPILDRFAEWDAEDEAAANAEREAAEAAERARIEAERAAIAAEQKKAAEVNRIEAERLAKEREAIAAERAAADKAAQIERARIAAEAAEAARILEESTRVERERWQAELDAKLLKERQEQAAKDAKAKAEQAERDRIAAELRKTELAERQRIADELAEMKRFKAEAEAEAKRLADAEAARIRAEDVAKAAEAKRLAMLPDIEKVQAFGVAVNQLRQAAPDVASEEAKASVFSAMARLTTIGNDLTAFGTNN